jgi:LuxR family maltose regulon positive regulatory protein
LVGPLIEVLCLQALALQAGQQTDRALAALRRSLSLAEPGGYIRSFVDEGSEMRELLVASQQQLGPALDASTAPLLSCTHRVLDAFSLPGIDAHPPQALSPQAMVEPLSERELEVLRLLAEGKSNREIGDALYIAVGTVKKHLSNIFGKLGVKNRTECAARAREWGLV